MNLAYYWYEAAHAGLSPARLATESMRLAFSNPANPLSYTPYGRTIAAACELFGRTTRRHMKPAFGLNSTSVAGDRVRVREAIEAAGAELRYLPPYSPDLNPIEMMFAKLKALLRKAAERTVAALWDRIGVVLAEFTPQECGNYLRHAGYGTEYG